VYDYWYEVDFKIFSLFLNKILGYYHDFLKFFLLLLVQLIITTNKHILEIGTYLVIVMLLIQNEKYQTFVAYNALFIIINHGMYYIYENS